MRGARVVAVSGIVGGKALKGPADRMLASLGHESSALGVARIYADFATDFVLDAVDAGLAPAIEALGLRAHVTDTIMADDAGRCPPRRRGPRDRRADRGLTVGSPLPHSPAVLSVATLVTAAKQQPSTRDCSA